MRLRVSLILLAAACIAQPAIAADTFTVHAMELADQKAVFATVESPNTVPARTRIGGTIASLSVRQGDAVQQGQVIAVIGDPKLVLQLGALDAQIAGLKSQLTQAETDQARAETLFRQGSGPKVALDQAHTAVEVASSALRARTAERSVIQQQLAEGAVLAPVAGRVLTVPLTTGSVVMNGDMVATIGEQPFLLRLRIPERHATLLKLGDPVRLDPAQLSAPAGAGGVITLIYPLIENGRVVADAKVADLGDFFVGDRMRVWISAGPRASYVIPGGFIISRFGIDYVRLSQPQGATTDVPVQRGQNRPDADQPEGVEILSGVRPGDVLVRP